MVLGLMHYKLKHNNARFLIWKLFYIIVNSTNFRTRYDYNAGLTQSQINKNLASLLAGSSDNGVILDGSDI